MEVARHVRRLEGERTPQLIEGAVEGASRRQDADDGMGHVVEENRPVQNRRVGAELIHPQHMAEDGHLVLAGLILVGEKGSAERGLDAEDVEVVRRDARAAQLDRVAHARERGAAAGLGRHEVEHGVVLLPVEKVQRGDAVALAARRLLEHAHDAVGVRVGERLQQQSVDEAEDGGVGADAERERQQRHDGESRTPRQGSHRISHVLQQ